MTREDAKDYIREWCPYDKHDEIIKALEQEPCDDVCEWFEQYVDIATDIVELRFSDGTVKKAKRGLYMRDIEKSIRKMLIDQMASDVLNKIRAEIMSKDGLEEALEIIDKYKEEIESQEKRCTDCKHYGKFSLDCSRCDDNCSMYEPQESEDK